LPIRGLNVGSSLRYAGVTSDAGVVSSGSRRSSALSYSPLWMRMRAT